MESYTQSENEINPINENAPPVLFESFPNNNNINNNPYINNNINDININESNFNLFPNNINNNNRQINLNRNINFNNLNNQKLQQPNFNSIPNQINQQQYLMRLNYINQIQKRNINNINNIYIPSYNINNSNIINIIKSINDDYNLSIDIDLSSLKMLDKENIIDIILFIRDICEIKIEEKFIRLEHKLFKINKIRGKNAFSFSIKNNIKESLGNNININNINEIEDNDNNSIDNEEDKDNYINENNIFVSKNKINEEENIDNNPNFMFCKLHQKLYFIYEYEEHLKTHKKCQICDNEFKSKAALKFTLRGYI